MSEKNSKNPDEVTNFVADSRDQYSANGPPPKEAAQVLRALSRASDDIKAGQNPPARPRRQNLAKPTSSPAPPPRK
jgi:hypothetical protein